MPYSLYKCYGREFSNIFKMKRVVVIGGGNLAESVAIAIDQCPKAELVQLYLRDAIRGEELRALVSAPVDTFEQPLAEADLYLLAVSDSAIEPLSKELNFAPNAIVAHTAGSTSIESINPKLRRAVFYPMQTFTRGRRLNFSEIPIFIEACDKQTLDSIREMAEAISSTVIPLTSEERRSLHLSAVFACNFVNAMAIAGEELVACSGLPFEILKPLIAECCAKALESQSPRLVQTGPATRGDSTTIAKHLAMLEKHETLKEIYQNISKYIWETSKKI